MTAFHPQSDGLVERFNKALEDIISKDIGMDQRGWDSSMGLLSMAYRTSEHESTGYSSNRMMFGWEPLLPTLLEKRCKKQVIGKRKVMTIGLAG